MQAIIAALCTVLSPKVVSHPELDTHKAMNLQLCKDAMSALDLAAEIDIEPLHRSAIDLCRSVYSNAQTV